MRFLKAFAGIALLIFSNSSFGQFTDHFDDTEFTSGPAWVGETSLYTVNGSKQLQSNGGAIIDTIYLTTPSSIIDSAEWEFWVKLNFAPSANNYVQIYLVSDQANLQTGLNGYFIKIGENLSADAIDLYRQDGALITPIISGRDSTMALSGSEARIRVRRDNLGNWTMWSDVTGGYNYVLEGTATDMTYTTTNTFGVYCRHTSTNNTKFLFDDFYAGTYQIDTFPPNLVSATATSATTVDAQFNEPLELISAQTAGNYSANLGLGPISTAIIDVADSSIVHLTFGTSFSNGVTYTLTVSGVKDTINNVMAVPQTATFSWFIPGTAAFRDVIINEIYADPDSNVANMPGSEFVEIYNRSTQVFDLSGWTFSDSSSSVTMGSTFIAPGEYIILCKSADTSDYNSWGTTLALSIPSLNNGGDNLGLRNNTGTLIDTVQYRLSWYNDAIKDDGGWTLELINPDDTCNFDGNWTASIDPDGGTPGTQNSVFNISPDTSAPQIVSTTVVSSTQVEVCFNESVDASAISTAPNFSINNGIGPPLSASPNAPQYTCVILTFPNPLTLGTTYILTCNNMSDCDGNSVSGLTATIIQGAAPNPLDIVINEIFADPSPVIGMPDGEFVEIMNAGTSAIELNNCQFTDGTTVLTLTSKVLMPGEFLILCEDAYEADYLVFGPTMSFSSFPSINNTGDSLVFMNGASVVIDLVEFTDDWYQDAGKKDGGWTLEKIDGDFPCPNSENWRASTNATGGTPGTANSIAGTFADNTPPSITYAVPSNTTTIRLYFNEALDGISATDPNNYTIDNGIGTPLNVAFAGPSLDAVDLLVGVALDTNVIYCVTATSVLDCPGNGSGVSQTSCFGLPLPVDSGDVVLNEILFNPYTGGSDYIELYNLSDKIIDLATLRIGEIFEGTDSVFNVTNASDSRVLMLPHTYICLTPDKAFQVSTYIPIDLNAIIETSDFPSFDDTEGECVILNDANVVLDRFHYLDDYQFVNLDDDEGVSLERLSFTGVSQEPGNWHSAASVIHYGTPGYKNSQEYDANAGNGNVWVEPETFSPDNDGFEDYITIHYFFPEPGTDARVNIFDNKGRLVKILKHNTLLGVEEGFFTWDGSTESGQKADVGIYVILFETTQPASGKKDVFKMGCVVAAKF